MLFSVLIPIYNAGKYLREAIDSVLNQTEEDYEIILVNDGSTDGSSDVCDEYAGKYGKISAIHKENGGLLSSRRTGLKASHGQYIIHLDQDDWLAEGALSRLKEVISSHDPDVIIYDYNRIDEAGNAVENAPLFSEGEGFVEKTAVLRKFAEGTRLNAMWIKCARRQVIDIDADYSGYGKLNMAEDELQTAALLEKAGTFYYLPERLYRYRLTGSSISRNFKLQYAIDSVKSKKRVEQMLETVGAEDSLFTTFYGAYVRCVLSYLLEAAKDVQDRKEFTGYKQQIMENGIPIEKIRVNTARDSVALALVKQNSHGLYRTVGKIYSGY